MPENNKKIKVNVAQAAVASDGYQFNVDTKGEMANLMFFQIMTAPSEDGELHANTVSNLRIPFEQFKKLGEDIDRIVASVEADK